MKKLIPFLLVSILIFTSCGKSSSCVPEEGDPFPPKITDTSSNESEHKNPFTGESVEQSSLLNRPVAVMINNISESLPQSGIGSADVVFEMPVEGGVTRLMAVYADYTTLPKIGSIRSARHDFLDIIAPFDPLFIHFGYSDLARQVIQQDNVSSINGIKIQDIAFYQDQSKLEHKSSEHTWYSDVEHLKKGTDSLSMTTTLDTPIEPMFKFSTADAMASYANATEAISVSVDLSGSSSSQFDYDSTTKMYVKSQNNKPHLDENLSKAIEVKNVLVMYTKIGLIPDTNYKDIDFSYGTGVYLSNGKQIPVTFTKDDTESYLKAYDETGAEINLNVGNTWVCIAPIQ